MHINQQLNPAKSCCTGKDFLIHFLLLGRHSKTGWNAMCKNIAHTDQLVFLAVQTSSIGDLVTHSLTDWVSNVYFCHTKTNPRDLLPLRHLIRLMRRHDLSEKDLPNSKNFLKIWKFQKFWKFPKLLNIFQKPKNFPRSLNIFKIWEISIKSINFPKIW